MIRDKEFDENALEGFIQSDSVGRNQYLNTFIGALNSVKDNTYISLDASWGSGKTVFMKQIEYLNYRSLEDLDATSIDINVIQSFQERYVVLYYNAWENDFHDDPLQSLLFNLIDTFYSDEKHRDKVKSLAVNAIKSIATETVKTLSQGIVDIDKIKDVETLEDLVSSITVANERKKAVTDIIEKIIPDGKKLLIIIDELDRCNPEFAMRLLEVVKHYYNDDKSVFVISTNNRQLVHTVKSYYGNEFDAYGYLDKMYDLILDLPPIDLDKYFQVTLGRSNESRWIDSTPTSIAKYLKMTMREANRYNTLLSFIEDRLRGRSHRSNAAEDITHFVFVPLAFALKVRDIAQYDKFISGEGGDIVRGLVKADETIQRLIASVTSDEVHAADKAVELYQNIMNSENLAQEQSNYHLLRAGAFFSGALPLLSHVRSIDNIETDAEPAE